MKYEARSLTLNFIFVLRESEGSDFDRLSHFRGMSGSLDSRVFFVVTLTSQWAGLTGAVSNNGKLKVEPSRLKSSIVYQPPLHGPLEPNQLALWNDASKVCYLGMYLAYLDFYVVGISLFHVIWTAGFFAYRYLQSKMHC